MNLLDTIDDILEQEDNILPKKKELEKIDFSFDEKIFSRMADFIINLDPDSLEDDQVETVIDLIDDLEMDAEEDIQEVKNPKLAKRTPATKNQYSKKWYRKNRIEIKRRKAKFKRSAEGRKRINKRERLARQGRTATGRRKVRYHVRKPSDRNDRTQNRTTDRRGRDENNRQDR